MGKAEVAWLAQRLGIPKTKLITPHALEDRLRVQKAAFLLKHLKVSPFTDYGFNLYVRGPYSPALATDYYDLSQASPRPVRLNKHDDELLDWFAQNDAKWLEVASSIILIKERYPRATRKEIHSVLQISKSWVDRKYFESVIKELVKRGLLK